MADCSRSERQFQERFALQERWNTVYRAYSTAWWRRLPYWLALITAQGLFFGFLLLVLVSPSIVVVNVFGYEWMWLSILITPATYMLLRHIPLPSFSWIREVGFDYWDERKASLDEEIDKIRVALDFRFGVRPYRSFLGRWRFRARRGFLDAE